MRVIASRQGYFGRLIEAGEAFDVPEDATATWFAVPSGGDEPEDQGDESAQGDKAKVTGTRSRKKAAASVPDVGDAPT